MVKPSSYTGGSVLQERADFLRLFMLTGAREAWPKLPDLPDDPLDLPEDEEIQTIVRSRVQMQALTLLQEWYKARPPALLPDSIRTPASEETRTAEIAKREAARRAAQQTAFGFQLIVGPSTAGVGSGDGVFLSGSAPPGSLVAFYPGVTYEMPDVLMLPGGTRFFEGNRHLMARFDKAIVDASVNALELLPTDARDTPLHVAHKANHPPRGAEPNVVAAPVEFNHAVPRELLTLLPNVSYLNSSHSQRLLLEAKPGSKGAAPTSASQRRDLADWVRASLADGLREAEPAEGYALKGLALIAAKPVQDEELFLNYRLNPRNGYPEWYVPVDPEEDKRRWS